MAAQAGFLLLVGEMNFRRVPTVRRTALQSAAFDAASFFSEEAAPGDRLLMVARPLGAGMRYSGAVPTPKRCRGSHPSIRNSW